MVRKREVNAFVHNVEKWPNMLLKSCGVKTASFLKYAWPLFNIIHENIDLLSAFQYLGQN